MACFAFRAEGRLLCGFLRGCSFGAGKNVSAFDKLAGIASEIACGIFLARLFRYFLVSAEFLTTSPARVPSSKASVAANFGLSRMNVQNMSTNESVLAFLRLMNLSNSPVVVTIPATPKSSLEPPVDLRRATPSGKT